jgi:hypothetical protein
MAAGRILRLDAAQWARAQEQAREGGGGTVVGTASADHKKAPVRETPDDATQDDASRPGSTPDKAWPATVLDDEDANLQWALAGAIGAVRDVPTDLSSES